jgi:large subunit ribosomal protein L16
MNYIPKKTKFKKAQRNRTLSKTNKVCGLTILNFGVIGLKATQSGEVTSKQIEAIRQSTSKFIKKRGRVNINIFAHTPVTAKPIETRMGKGKGNINKWVYRIKCGETICEIKTSFIQIGLKALKSCQIKLPIKTKIVKE